jgi:large subunit ribosomal protein L29
MIEMDTLRGQTVAELVKQARNMKDELFHSKFAHATQQLKDPNKIRTMRRDIARVKTALTEKLQGHEHKAKAAHAHEATKTKKAEAKAKTAAAKPAKSAASKAEKSSAEHETAGKKPAAKKTAKAKKAKE